MRHGQYDKTREALRTLGVTATAAQICQSAEALAERDRQQLHLRVFAVWLYFDFLAHPYQGLYLPPP